MSVKPVPPKNPITIKINEMLTRNFFEHWAEIYLPDYGYIITSHYRDPQENRDVGGVSDSAHLYALALDIVLTKNGKPIPREKAKQIFDEVIQPKWEGFALWEGDHIHLNLDREITNYTKYLGYAAGAILAAFTVKKLSK